MNVEKILSQVDSLHQKAVRKAHLTLDGERYDFEFNGRNYVVTSEGQNVIELNTRSIAQAKTWLKDWLAN